MGRSLAHLRPSSARSGFSSLRDTWPRPPLLVLRVPRGRKLASKLLAADWGTFMSTFTTECNLRRDACIYERVYTDIGTCVLGDNARPGDTLTQYVFGLEAARSMVMMVQWSSGGMGHAPSSPSLPSLPSVQRPPAELAGQARPLSRPSSSSSSSRRAPRRAASTLPRPKWRPLQRAKSVLGIQLAAGSKSSRCLGPGRRAALCGKHTKRAQSAAQEQWPAARQRQSAANGQPLGSHWTPIGRRSRAAQWQVAARANLRAPIGVNRIFITHNSAAHRQSVGPFLPPAVSVKLRQAVSLRRAQHSSFRS